MKSARIAAATLIAATFALPAGADVINGRVYADEPRVGVNAMTVYEPVGAMGDDAFFRGNNPYLARDAEAQERAGYGMTRLRSGYGAVSGGGAAETPRDLQRR